MQFFCFYLPETCVFAFLGLSIFSFPHKFEISFVIWCIVGAPSLFKNASLILKAVIPGHVSVSLCPQVLVLLGRAVNIFPLSFLLNFFRDHKITPKMMFIMWFSGERIQSPLRQADSI